MNQLNEDTSIPPICFGKTFEPKCEGELMIRKTEDERCRFGKTHMESPNKSRKHFGLNSEDQIF